MLTFAQTFPLFNTLTHTLLAVPFSTCVFWHTSAFSTSFPSFFTATLSPRTFLILQKTDGWTELFLSSTCSVSSFFFLSSHCKLCLYLSNCYCWQWNKRPKLWNKSTQGWLQRKSFFWSEPDRKAAEWPQETHSYWNILRIWLSRSSPKDKLSKNPMPVKHYTGLVYSYKCLFKVTSTQEKFD